MKVINAKTVINTRIEFILPSLKGLTTFESIVSKVLNIILFCYKSKVSHK
jgi:hypothetical protein